ncbi:hypothetical protein [Argonema antarcticum]|uniref:hypothetical protein n=1 Tax=Argonema antarcticum TaxID=2942763 RepID=UPI002012302B|nr:hypothetical protein [Argonema antarcticum]MCL1474442.1 hypothetical protein [Argonema antarcticum A004/B2]
MPISVELVIIHSTLVLAKHGRSTTQGGKNMPIRRLALARSRTSKISTQALQNGVIYDRIFLIYSCNLMRL